MAINYKGIGERIQQLRKMRNLSVEEVAKQIQFTPKSLILAEHGQATIGLDFLLPICNALAVTPNDLLAGEFTAVSDGSVGMELALIELNQLKALINGLKLEQEEGASSGTIIKDTETALDDIRQMVIRWKLEEKVQANGSRAAKKAPQPPTKKRFGA